MSSALRTTRGSSTPPTAAPSGTAEGCVLCLRAVPTTREHVFARWLVSRVRGARLVASSPLPMSTEAPDGPPRIARVIAAVCADCNAGWMSGLEVSFRQTLFARARVGPLHAPERVTLSRWFTKTAVLLAHVHGAALLSEAQRPRLVTGMPDDIEVFIGRRRRPRQHLDYALDGTSDPATGRLHVRSVAIQVDGVVGHVAPRGTLRGRGTRLWPLRTHMLRWETLPVVTDTLPDQTGRSGDRR